MKDFLSALVQIIKNYERHPILAALAIFTILIISILFIIFLLK